MTKYVLYRIVITIWVNSFRYFIIILGELSKETLTMEINYRTQTPLGRIPVPKWWTERGRIGIIGHDLIEFRFDFLHIIAYKH